MNINKTIKTLLAITILTLSSSTHLLCSSKSQPKEPVSKTYSAENGSYYGEISKKTKRPKSVYVKGYTRKDGTYVRGHYRSKRK